MKSLLLFGLGITIGGAFGFWGQGFYASIFTPNEKNVEIREGGYKYINPLLFCEGNQNSQELIPFKNRIQEVIKKEYSSGRATKIAFYFRDLNNGPWISINSEEKFAPASLLKVPVMMAYYKKADFDSSILKKEIIYTDNINSERSPYIKPQQSIVAGKKYKIEEAINYMIANSDNKAFYLLANEGGEDFIFQIFKDLNMKEPTPDTPEDYITVRQYASFFRILFNGSYISQNMSEKALDLLTKVQFKEGLPSGVPKNIPVAHKFGERYWEDSTELQLHDCGIVYYPYKPYLICIMTRGDNFDELVGVIGEISRRTYEEVDNQLKRN